MSCVLMTRWASAVALVLILVTSLTGCSSMTSIGPPLASATVTVAAGDGLSHWTAIRFRLAQRDAGEIDSYLDALIADRILAEQIVQEQHALTLWRFHRRWPQDSTGHQFSFLFFASAATTERVVASVQAHPLLKQLRSDGHLIKWGAERPGEGQASDPADTSDPSWPPEIQREWPQFIMGASRTWLGLVQSEARKHPQRELHARYQAVETALDRLWFEQANHAFFHHLSALFGYKPVRVIRRDIMTF